MRCAGHVARSTHGRGERRGAYRILVGKLDGRDHLEDPSVDGWIILKFIFSSCKHSNELPDSIKGAELLD